MSAERRAQLIDRVLAVIDEHYLQPERVQAIATAVRACQAAGRYDDLQEAVLATALADGLRAAGGDDLLAVRFRAPSDDGKREHSAARNFGFERAERLQDNLGLLVLTSLSAAEEPSAARAASGSDDARRAHRRAHHRSAQVRRRRRQHGGAARELPARRPSAPHDRPRTTGQPHDPALDAPSGTAVRATARPSSC